MSWSSIDFFGNWKALHYQAKRSFENLLISSEIVDDTLQVYVINDYLKEFKDSLKIEVLDFNGNKLQEYSKNVLIQPNSSDIYFKIPIKGYSIVANRIVFVATFQEKQSLFYMAKPKELALENVTINKSIREVTNGFEIEITSKVLQKNVFLYTDQKGHFSDNFFDLFPGEVKTVFFKSNKKNNFVLQLITLNELISVQ